MASNEVTRFDDSDDEEDFNPAPADLSDDEGNSSAASTSLDARGSGNSRHHRQPVARDEHSGQGSEDGGSANGRTVSPALDDTEGEKKARSMPDSSDDDEDDEGRSLAGDKAGGTPDNGENQEAEEEDEEEENNEDEDDEDEDVQQGHRRKRRRDRRQAFFDIEAEVDDEDEGEDEERDGEEIEDFIDNAHPDDLNETERLNDDRRHRELDQRREMEASLDAEKQAEAYRQKYGNRRSTHGLSGSAIVPRRLLLPGVKDPSIWAVRCKEGKEREVVFSIMRRVEERAGTKDELAITSAFERGGSQSIMKGLVYVEAPRQVDVHQALDGLLNVYPRTKMIMMEIKEMPDLFRVAKTPTLEPGAWVRLKRPLKHSGDLAQVLDVTENGLEARVKFIPRLDYGVRDEATSAVTADGKRKRPLGVGPRPSQRLFSEAEARKRHPRHVQTTGSSIVYMGDEFENGFQVRDIRIQQLTTSDVNPTLEEVTRFASGAEDGAENLDLKALAATLKDSNSLVTYLPGDVVEVFTGEQKGVVGKATNVQGDIVTMIVTEGDLNGQTIEVPTKGLRKRFSVGDHVKVIGGSKYRDEVGIVINISEDRVTLLTDNSNTEVTVFSRDLREASDTGGQASLGQYELYDLVQLDPSTVGCVVKVDRESLIVLDQYGDARQVMPTQISNKLPKRKQAVNADRNGSEIRLDDVVKEYNGQRRQGKIIHIHRSYIFLHSHDLAENTGVFVTKGNMVTTIAAKGGRVNPGASGPDLSTMNPAMKLNRSGSDQQPVQPPKSFGRDRAINQTVVVKKGNYKGLLGIVKDTTETHARVELHTKGKTITVAKDVLSYKDKTTGATIDINGRGRGLSGGYGRNEPSTDRVSGWQGNGRTPMGASGMSDRVPAWGSRTPSISPGGRTPAWKAQDISGSRTPAWADGSRTVNPYDGSRTAYGSGSRTPAWQSGARTPAAGDTYGAGSRTPAYGDSGSDGWNSGSRTPAWGISAPTPSASGSDPWGYGTGASSGGAYDAPTPGLLNAPTPGVYSAPTPAAGAPTPGDWQGGWGSDLASTPALGAPTPSAGGYYGAPTPGTFGATDTPAGTGPRYTDDD